MSHAIALGASVQLLESLREFFDTQRLQAYVVGGFVRNRLLGRPCHDVDLAVAGDAEVLARGLAAALGGAFVPLDPERGIFRVVLRQEIPETSDPLKGPWTVDLSTLVGGDIYQDLARRDFTVDAMAVPCPVLEGPPAGWPLLDPFRGRQDLQAHLVRALGNNVFRDDPLRLLRAVRLGAQLGFTLEATTEALLTRDAPLLAQVSGERLRDELLTILSLPGLGHSLELLDRTGLLVALLPELAPAKGVTQPFEHHWDVYDHSLQCAGMVERVLAPEFRQDDPAGQAVPWEPWLDEHFAQEVTDGHTRATLLKLTALLHDVAKPETKTVEPSGRARFLGHSELGASKAEAILRRLRLSGRGISMVRTLIEHHLRPSQMAQRDLCPTPRAIYRYFKELDNVAVDALYLNLADYLAARGPTLDLEKWQAHCQLIGFTLERGTAQAHPSAEGQQKLIDGHDLQQLFGLSPGPSFRPILEAVQEAQATGEVRTREEALELVRALLRRSETPEHSQAPQIPGERYV